jgi:hypothetical protein
VALELTQYLESIKGDAKLGPADESGVMNELKSHIEDRVEELTETGLTEEEALKTCLGQMGSTKMIARRIYEAYSQASWKQVLLAAMPHLLFGALFVLDWWQYPGWLSIVLVAIMATTIYGWGRGKPTWLFTWLGYALLPVLLAGILLLYVPSRWSWLAIPIYFPLALWWLFRIIVQTTRRDWLLSTLMLLPLPIIAGWFLAILSSGRINEESLRRVYYLAPWIGLSFLILAATIVAFLRLRQRALRVGLLAASGMLTLALVVYYSTGRLDMPTFFGLMLVMWGVFLAPPILERYLVRNRRVMTWGKRRPT